VKLAIPFVAVAIFTVAGCQSSGKPSSALQPSPAVTDLTPTPAAEPAMPAQPAANETSTGSVDTTVTPMSDVAAPGDSSGKYTIKPGDTLYRIAVNHYGDGKQWKKIAEANPGISPTHLKVGQEITLP
jgi:5'-nucleotidase / UDP-sugar diphosphatase